MKGIGKLVWAGVLGIAALVRAEHSFVVSDPCIWRDDAAKVYRLYQLSRSTEPWGAGVMMRTSTNLVDWSAMTQVMRVPDEYNCFAVWAPEMHAYNGAYYIFGTIATKPGPENTVQPIPGWTGYGTKLRKRLSTYIFKADRPEGPYEMWSEGPITPREWAALDGTLFVEDGTPYMVFCHEWTQVRDGTMEAVALSPDLKRPVGKPFTLFRASDRLGPNASKKHGYVTDGPWFYRSKSGALFMLWSTGGEGYLQLASRSESGRLRGPWTDHTVLYREDSGHGMIFETFDGRTLIAFHSVNGPGSEKRLRIHELIDEGQALRIGRQVAGDFTPRPSGRWVPARQVTVKVKTAGTPTVSHPPRYAIVPKAKGSGLEKIESLFCRVESAPGRVLVECTNLSIVPQPVRFELDDGRSRNVTVPAGESRTFAFPAPTVRAAVAPAACGYVVATDYVKADGRTDVADALQRLIDTHPNRTIFFPDGVYLLGKPIATPADPTRSVDLRLSNFAILRAASDWGHTNAMVRLGGVCPANNITKPGSCYGMTGGVVDGAGRADGVSIDGGRETKIRDVSMKNVRVGIHIKYGANSGSSDADITDVNIVGNGAADSVGVIVEGHDNTLSNMRIAHVCTGVRVKSGSNFLRNIHPLFTGAWRHYASSIGFDDAGGNTYYDGCYSDQFQTGFRLGERLTVMDNCQIFWYSMKPDSSYVGIRATGAFNALCTGLRIAFKEGPAMKTVLQTGKDGGKGFLRDLRMDESRVTEKEKKYLLYKQGECH